MNFKAVVIALIAFGIGVAAGRLVAPAPEATATIQPSAPYPAASSPRFQDAATPRPSRVSTSAPGAIQRPPSPPADGAIADALSLRNVADRFQSLKQSFRDLANREGFAALDAALALGVPAERGLAVSVVLDVIAQDDPQRVLEIAQGYSGGLRRTLVGAAARALAMQDPVTALAACAATHPGYNRCPQNVYQQWTMLSPQDAIAYAMATDGQSDFTSNLSTIFWSWSYNDPAAAAQWLQGEGTDLLDENKRLNMAAYLVRDDPSLLAQIKDGFSGNSLVHLESMRINAIANQNIEQAVAEVNALMGDRKFGPMARSLAQAWSRRDPAAATRWIASWPEDALGTGRTSTARNYYQSDSTLRDSIRQWAGSDAAAASRFVAALPDQNKRKGAYSVIFGQRARKDPQAALQWLATLPEGDIDDNVVSSGINWNRADDPARMITALKPYADTSWGQAGTMQMIQQLANVDYTQAQRLLPTLKDSSQAADVAATIARSAVREAPDQTLTWALGLQGAARDAALVQLAGAMTAKDGSPSRIIANISDSKQRVNAVLALVQMHAQSDRQFAEQIVEQADLSDQYKTMVRSASGLD